MREDLGDITSKIMNTLQTTNYEKQRGIIAENKQHQQQQTPDSLQTLMEEVEKWSVENNPEQLLNIQRHFKFTDIDHQKRAKTILDDVPSLTDKRAKTINISFTDYGALDLNYLQSEIERCSNDEYIKVRIPSDVDISDVTLRDSFGKRNSEKERPKTMTEYFC